MSTRRSSHDVQSLADTIRKRLRSLRPRHRKIGVLEKKLGIFGTRGGATTAIFWLIAIAVTPWLRWFVAGSVFLGLLFATILVHLHDREPRPRTSSNRTTEELVWLIASR